MVVAIRVMTLLMPGVENTGNYLKISSLKGRWGGKENSYLENTTGSNANVMLCLFPYSQIVLVITSVRLKYSKSKTLNTF